MAFVKSLEELESANFQNCILIVGGEVEYLKYISSSQDKVSLVINIDSPCHAGSKIAANYINLCLKKM